MPEASFITGRTALRQHARRKGGKGPAASADGQDARVTALLREAGA